MNLIASIRQQLSEPLPGKNAHMRLAPFAARLNYTIPEDAYQAGVLILLYSKNNAIHFPLITRTSNHIEDKHRGQIALPGGRKDNSDSNMMMTCIRECTEEIGIVPEQIEMLGALSPLYIPVSYHHVFPFVAYYHGESQFVPELKEIVSIHEVKVSDLYNPKNRLTQQLKTTEGPIMIVPTIQIDQLTIWGATAMILEEFSDVFSKVNTPYQSI